MHSCEERKQGLAIGKQLRDHGMAIADRGHHVEKLQFQIRILNTINEHGTATSDDGYVCLKGQALSGGKWVGPAIKSLERYGAIRCDGHTISARPARHGGPVRIWTIDDPKRFHAKRAAIQTELDQLEKIS